MPRGGGSRAFDVCVRMTQPDDIDPSAPAPPSPRALRDAVRQLIVAQGAYNPAQRPCGEHITAPHAWALMTLHAHGAMTITALAHHLNIDRTNVSRLCGRMEAGGELERAPHPEDRRARLVRLTARGERAARAIDATSAAHFARVLERLESDGASDLVHALNTLAQAIHACAPRVEPSP